MKALGLLSLLIVLPFAACPWATGEEEKTPEARALAFLAREIPRWKEKNKCYSCHNNGDAARALCTAVRLGRAVPHEALADTTSWLARPAKWDKPESNGPQSDERLLRIQFAAALTEALDAGLVKDKAPLLQAAELVAEQQDKSGAWLVLPEGALGNPTTYGAALGTYLARTTLQKADPNRYAAAIARAGAWLRNTPIKSNLDAASVLLALEHEEVARRAELLALLRRAQTKQGGWGPRADTPPEPFDTAVVLLALVRWNKETDVRDIIRRGRDYLVAAQNEDGSWPETTRPAGGDSYAQRLSTSGWATRALLLTANIRP